MPGVQAVLSGTIAAMRILILGGTWFLGRELAQSALARGWEVTSFTRGRSGPPPEGVEHVTGDRRSTDDLRRLAESGPWDATVDTSAYEPGDVTQALAELGDHAGLYVLMSTVLAYRDWPERPVDETDDLWPARMDARESDPDVAGLPGPFQYGTLKAGCELAAAAAPGGALILRPGVILGPGEYTGRMLSLFEHAQRDAVWLLPPPDPRIQPVDVRDVAQFALDQIAAARPGIYNLTAPFGDLIDACLEATEGAANPVHANDEWLIERGVRQWTEIPLWRTNPGTWQVNGAKAAAAGFTCKPLRETVLDTWAGYQKQQPVYHPDRTGTVWTQPARSTWSGYGAIAPEAAPPARSSRVHSIHRSTAFWTAAPAF